MFNILKTISITHNIKLKKVLKSLFIKHYFNNSFFYKYKLL